MKRVKQLIKSVPGCQQILTLRASLRTLFRLNWRKTILVNFRFLKFSEAIKFPIYVYGKLYLLKSQTGKIIIKAPVKRGMICMGINWDNFSASRGSALLDLHGSIIFHGECIFSVDTSVQVLESAEIDLERFTFLGNSVKIKCYKKIHLGESTRIGVESQLFDTNFHFVKDLKTGEIHNNITPIYIGNRCWIGNRTSIMKGTTLPDGCIISSNSLLNKDYIAKGVQPYSVLAGTPAKVVGEAQTRIFSIREEQRLRAFFDMHPNEIYQGTPSIEDETKDLTFYFNWWR